MCRILGSFFGQAVVLLFAVVMLNAADTPQSRGPAKPVYRKPPKVITDILESPAPPTTLVSPSRDRVLVIDSLRHPPIADLAQPMLRIAGLRINPATNGRHHPPRHIGLRLITIADGKEIKLAAPADAWLSVPLGGLWMPGASCSPAPAPAPSSSGLGSRPRCAMLSIPGVATTSCLASPCNGCPGVRITGATRSSASRSAPSGVQKLPTGPTIQESAGKPVPARTYEDLLQNAHDDHLFDSYATSQLALIDVVKW